MPQAQQQTKRFIGFDLGAESGRCVVATLHDGKLTLDEVHRFATHNVMEGSSFRWDILAINAEIVEGLSKAQKEFGSGFDGIGVDTWGVDYVLVDPGARVLGYPYHYRDSRTDGIMEEAFGLVSAETMYQATGVQFAQYNTVFQLLAETKNTLNLLDIADKMLLMPDYLNFFLSGVQKAEFSIASTTGLADPRTRNWSWDLIERFGIRREIFPEMIEPGTHLGMIRPELAEQTGLNRNTPIIASGGHDTASAVASVPAMDGRWAFLSSGTWSLMGVELPSPLLVEAAMKCNFTNDGGVAGTTRFLKNIIGLWPVQECKRFWHEKGEDYSYSELAEMGKEEGFAGAWVDLNDPRFLKQGEMPLKISAYLQETGQETKPYPGYITRVVLESLAFSYRKTIKQIEEIAGGAIEKLHAVGGGIKNELLMQLTADATGISVYSGPVEGTIVGNIGVQAIATKSVPDLAAWRDVVAKSFELKVFRPDDSFYFRSNEELYDKCLKAGR